MTTPNAQLLALADELETTGASSHLGSLHAAGVVAVAPAEGEPPQSCLGIPDWTLAHAYRQAVDRIDPDYPEKSVLAWAANITVAADHLATAWRDERRDYSKDPRALAQWMTVHWRSDWEGMSQRVPELVWIYETLLTAAPGDGVREAVGEVYVEVTPEDWGRHKRSEVSRVKWAGTPPPAGTKLYTTRNQ